MIGKLLFLLPIGMVLVIVGIVGWIILFSSGSAAHLCSSYTNRAERHKAAIDWCTASPSCVLAVDDIHEYNATDILRKHHCEAAEREQAP